MSISGKGSRRTYTNRLLALIEPMVGGALSVTALLGSLAQATSVQATDALPILSGSAAYLATATQVRDYVLGISAGTATIPEDLAVGHAGPPLLELDVVGQWGVRPTASGYPTVLAEGFAGRFYMVHTSGDWGLVLARAANDAFGANLTFYHTRSSNAGTRAAVTSGDYLARITFQGATSAAQVLVGAAIRAVVNGTVNTGALPTEIQFWTGATNNVEDTATNQRLRIRSGGAVILSNTGWLGWRNAADSADLNNIRVSSANNLVLNAPTGSGVYHQVNETNVFFSLAAGVTVVGTITMSTAASQIIPGATSWAVRNNANSADNLIILNAGDATFRASLTVQSTLTTNGTLAEIAQGATTSTTRFGTGSGSSSTLVDMRRLAGQEGSYQFSTGTSRRWRLILTSTAESGANAGSALVVQAYDDAGVSLGSLLTFTRAAGGSIAFDTSRPVTLGILSVANGAVGAPSFTFTSDTTLGLYRIGAGILGFAASGAEAMRLTSTALTQTGTDASVAQSTTTAQLTVGTGTGSGSSTIILRGAAGQIRGIQYRSAAASAGLRWNLLANNTAESGADAGTPFQIAAYTDAGVFIDSPLVITRAAAGTIAFSGARPITGFTYNGQTISSSANFTGTVQIASHVTLTGGDLRLNTPLGANGIVMQDAGVNRAIIRLNAGVVWVLNARDTGGASIDNVFSLVLDAGGALTIARPVIMNSTATIASTLTHNGSTANLVQSATNSSVVIGTGAGSSNTFVVVQGAVSLAHGYIWRIGTSNRWILQTDGTAEPGANAGTALNLLARTDAGAAIDTVLAIARAAGGAITWATGRPMTVGGLLTVAAQGQHIIGTAAGTSTNLVIQAAAGNERALYFRSGTSVRWVLSASATAESGANAGSPFAVTAFDDAGAFIDTAISILRSANGTIAFSATRPITGGLFNGQTISSAANFTGAITVATTLTQNGTAANLVQSATSATVLVGSGTGSGSTLLYVRSAAGQYAQVGLYSGTTARWIWYKDNNAEAGANAGSTLRLAAHDDTGAFIDNVVSFTRAAAGGIAFASGRPITGGTYNSQTISATANLTGTLTIASTTTITAGGIVVSAGGAAITGNSTVTGSLTVTSGVVVSGGVVSVLTGSAGTPTYTFDGDPDTGFYRVTFNTIGLSAAGANQFQISNTGCFIQPPTTFVAEVLLAAATTSRPSIRVPSGTAPSAPTDGDIWNDGTQLRFYEAAASQYASWTEQAAVADATGAGDVVAQLNSLLAKLRTINVIAP